MVSALIQLDEDTNRAISVIKAREGLKDKGEAISFIVKKYFQNQEPELLPEFVEKILSIEKNGKYKRYKVGEFLRDRSSGSNRKNTQ